MYKSYMHVARSAQIYKPEGLSLDVAHKHCKGIFEWHNEFAVTHTIVTVQ